MRLTSGLTAVDSVGQTGREGAAADPTAALSRKLPAPLPRKPPSENRI